MSEGVEGLDVQRVEALLGLRRAAHAEAAARALVGADPGSAGALLLLARALLLQDKYPAAAEAARAAIVLEPDNAVACRVLADALVDLDPAAAIGAAQRAVEMAPHDPIAHYVLGRALTHGKRGQRREAVAVAERTVELAPFWAEAANLLGLALSGVGRNDEARAAYLRALELDPTHAYAKNNLAALDLDRGRLGRAARSLTSALADEPQDHTLHQNLDLLLLKLLQRIWWGTLVAAGLVIVEAVGRAPWALRFLTGVALVGFMAMMVRRSARDFPRGSPALARGCFGA